MATPQSMASQEESSNAKKLEQITFRFCSECSNMLYPKEDEDAHKLQFTCRTCQYTEEASSSCVFRNVLNNSAGETAGVTQDVASDPTVSEVLPVFCLTCGTIIFCDFCSHPAVFMSLFDREDREAAKMGLAHFVLALVDDDDDDPFADIDEEPQDDGGEPDDPSATLADSSTLDASNGGGPVHELRGMSNGHGHHLIPHINGETRHEPSPPDSHNMVVHI